MRKAYGESSKARGRDTEYGGVQAVSPSTRHTLSVTTGVNASQSNKGGHSTVVGHVQAMLERFQQSFELRLSQMEAKVPREPSRSPLHDPAPTEGRIDEFSSQEDSAANDTVKVASVIRVLSPGVAQADHQIMLNQQGGDILTVHLGAAESTPACRSISTDSVAERSHVLGRESKRRRRRRRGDDATLLRLLGRIRSWYSRLRGQLARKYWRRLGFSALQLS